VSIRLLQQLGVRRFIDYATRLGMDTSDFAPDLSLALGTHAMTPLELAAPTPFSPTAATASSPT
jgi:penicillin-binding protein 1A